MFQVSISVLVQAFVFHHLTKITLKLLKVFVGREEIITRENLCSTLLFNERNNIFELQINSGKAYFTLLTLNYQQARIYIFKVPNFGMVPLPFKHSIEKT